MDGYSRNSCERVPHLEICRRAKFAVLDFAPGHIRIGLNRERCHVAPPQRDVARQIVFDGDSIVLMVPRAPLST
jgi:hypothetical protein